MRRIALLRHLRQELAQLLGAGMHEAETDMGELRIAAGFVLGRLLEHDDAFGAGLPGRDRGFERGAAAADDDDVAGGLRAHGFFALLFVRGLSGW